MYKVQGPSDQFLIFVDDDQGHDHVHHGACDCDISHGHVGVNGIVKDEGGGG